MDYLQERYGMSIYFQDLLEIVEKLVAALLHTAEAVAGAYQQSEIGYDDLERAVDSFPFLRRALHSGRLHIVRSCRSPETAVVSLRARPGVLGWPSAAVCVPAGPRDSECLISLSNTRDYVIAPEEHAPRITRYYMVYRGVQPLQASTAGLGPSALLQQNVLAAGVRQITQDPHLQLTPEAVEASLLTDLVVRSAVMSEQREAGPYIHALSEIDVSGIAGLLLQHILSLAWSSLSAGRGEQLGALLSVVDALMQNPSLENVEHFTVIMSLLLTVVGSGSEGVSQETRERAVTLLTKCLSISEQFDQAILRKVGGILINGVFGPNCRKETRAGCARALAGVNSEEMFSLLVRKMLRQKERGQELSCPEAHAFLIAFCKKQIKAAIESDALLGSGDGMGGATKSGAESSPASPPAIDYTSLTVCGVPALTLVGLFGEECIPDGM